MTNYQKDESEFFELLSYGAAVQDQISYNHKDEYLSLIKEYLAERITAIKFRNEFFELQKEDERAAEMILNDLKQFATFPIDPKSEDFASIIYKIYNNCMVATEFSPEERITEYEFLDYTKKIFSEIQIISHIK